MVMKGQMRSLAAGLTAGLDNLGTGVAFAALLFSGPLAAGLGMGVAVLLLSGIVLSLFIALRSPCKGNVALVQETGIAILASSMAGILEGMDGQDTDRQVATVIAVLGSSTMITGFSFLLFGRLRLGSLVRFLPYPVIAGFLSGTGWLLIEGALVMVAGGHSLTDPAGILHDPVLFGALLPAILMALLLAVCLGRLPHPLTMPLALAAAAMVFYAVISALGITADQARAWSWLPDVPADAMVSLPSPLWTAAQADWMAVVQALPVMAAIAILNIIGLLLNTSGLEAASGREVDANAELRESGIANLLAGCFGGAAGYTGLSLTLLAAKMQAATRLTGVAAGGILLVSLPFAGTLAAAMPGFLAAGLMIFLGAELIYHWAIAARRKLPQGEWLIVLAILASVAILGFLYGLVLGLAFSVVMFVYNYARLPVVRMEADVRRLRSGVDRSPEAVRALDQKGEQIHVLRLQGYLFFGTMEQAVARVRQRAGTAQTMPLRFLIIDLGSISGMDSAAAAGFAKIHGMTSRAGVRLIFSAMPPAVASALARLGLCTGADHGDTARPEDVACAADLDHALELCEDALLTEEKLLPAGGEITRHLESILGSHPRLGDLAGAMQRLELPPGTALIRAGDPADDVFLVSEGRVRIQMDLPDGRTLRLRSMTAGAVVGEVGHCLNGKRTADVVVETPAIVYRLSRAGLEGLERTDSELALLFHRLLAVTLAEKLVLANRMVQLAHG
jgi:SulP family sulfate permease